MSQKIIDIVLIILLGIIIYLRLRPVPERDYKKEFIGIQDKIDSLNSKISTEKRSVDSLVLVRKYYHEKLEVIKSEIQSLPLDSAVELLRKNLVKYEESNSVNHRVLDSISGKGSRDFSN